MAKTSRGGDEAAARLALQRFWGSNGGDERFEELREALQAAKLSEEQLFDLDAWLPQPGGLTQQNVDRASRLLVRMARG